MKGDKFLTAILAGIGILILAALAIFFLRQSRETYLPDDTPEGVVHNYLLAILQKDYVRAYGYLAEGENKPSYEDFEMHFLGNSSIEENSIEIGETRFVNDKALVQVILSNGTDPYRSYYTEGNESARLIRQDGQWRITEMPLPFWGWTWYQEYQNDY